MRSIIDNKLRIFLILNLLNIVAKFILTKN